LNEELQTRNSEIIQINNDLSNLLSSVNLPILMLGNDLTIRRFTAPAEKFFNLIATDIGRRISDINPNVNIPELDKRVREVIDSLGFQEHEVQDRDGRWYSLRIRPYRTAENKIDGAVVVLVDINEIKRGLEEILQLVREPLLMLSGDFRVVRANRAFFDFVRLSPEEVEGVSIFEIGHGEWNIPGLHALLEGVLPEKKRVEDFRIDHQFPTGRKALEFRARILHQESKGTQLILLAIDEAE
jgi:two-component system CheB/CheR fusion protein